MSYNDRLREAAAWVAAHRGETITLTIPKADLAEALWDAADCCNWPPMLSGWARELARRSAGFRALAGKVVDVSTEHRALRARLAAVKEVAADLDRRATAAWDEYDATGEGCHRGQAVAWDYAEQAILAALAKGGA